MSSNESFWEIAKKQNWTTYDYAASIVFWATGCTAVPLNGILLYLIIFHSPKTLQRYSIFIFNVTLSDFVFSLSSVFAQIRIIPNKWAFAYVSLGPAGWIGGAQGGYFAYCVMLHSLFYTFLCFPISFGFRYWILVRPMPSRSNCILLCFVLWLIALGQHILFIFSESPNDRIREYLKINKPQYDLDNFFISGNHMIESPLTSITLATIVLPMFPIYVIVIYFYKKVHHFLLVNTTKMSIGTIRGHKKLIELLTIHASLPILFVFPPIILYGLYHLEFIHVTIAEYLVYTIFSFLPLASPIVSLIYIKPYNMAFRRLFCKMIVTPAPAKHVYSLYGESNDIHHSSTRFD